MIARNAYPGLNLVASDIDSARTEELMFGFWVFLMSDLVTFGLFFATYVTMSANLAGGPGPLEVFNLSSVGWQTGCLLISSFAIGLAGLALKYETGRTAPVILWLAVSGLLGGAFLVLEVGDFLHAAAIGAVPSRSGFLSAYYALVGLHGVHVLAGVLWLVLMIARLATSPPSQNVRVRVLRLALYWHFLDLVWIAIFSVVFLSGVA